VSLDVSQPYGSLRPVTGITLLLPYLDLFNDASSSSRIIRRLLKNETKGMWKVAVVA
jgi:hypothetical protein